MFDIMRERRNSAPSEPHLLGRLGRGTHLDALADVRADEREEHADGGHDAIEERGHRPDGLALHEQERGRDRHDEAREHGYQNGYRDGMNHGRYDRMQGYRYNYKSDQWEDADGGYQHWMGSRGRYKNTYRDGYVNGYGLGYGMYGFRRGGDRDRDDDYRGHDRDDWR